NIPLTGGISCVDIENCQFPPECDANEIASSLEQIVSLLAQDGNLTSATAYPFGTHPIYPSLTSLMLTNTVSGTASSLTWSFNTGTTTATIGSSGDDLILQFTSSDPAGFSAFGSIGYFDNIVSNNQHYFSVDAYDLFGNFLATLFGEAFVDDGVSLEPVEMGSCELPSSLLCQEEAHHVLDDLFDILTEVLLEDPFNPNIDLFSSTSMTSLIAGFFDPIVISTSSTVQQNAVTGGFENTLLISTSEGASCDWSLSFISPNAGIGFDDLLTLESIAAVPPINNFNSYNNFEIVAIFDDGLGGTFTTTIFGSSCLPIKNCEDRDPEEPASECELLYQQYVAAYENLTPSKICKFFPTLYSYEDFLEANYCCDDHALLVFAEFVAGFDASDCGILAQVLPPCNEGETGGVGTPIKSDGSVQLEQSVEKLAMIEQSVIELNNRESFVSGTPEYVKAPSLTETIVKDYTNFYDSYKVYLDNYNPAIDNSSYLYSIEEFIHEYGYCTNVTMEYNRYVNAVNDYNNRAVINGVATMTAMDELTFTTEGLACHCTGYVNYIEACPVGGIGASEIEPYMTTSGVIDPTASANTCDALYQDYLIAYRYFKANNVNAERCIEFTPLISQTDFEKNNLCYSPEAMVVFQKYVQSFYNLATCPNPFPKFNPSTGDGELSADECKIRFASYLNLTNSYNASAYAVAMGHFLATVSYEAFLLRHCACFDAYLLYLRPYLNTPPNFSPPLPVDMAHFAGCREEPTEDPCDEAYAQYQQAIADYDTYVVVTGNGWPTIKVEYKPSQFTANGFCYCVEAYVAYLNALITGNEDVPATEQEFLSVLDLATHCEEAPCVPDAPPGLGQFVPVVSDSLVDHVFNKHWTLLRKMHK
ncbi:MAG: hypothetical protein JKY54_06860, partial [Flavobacteriales bacterium]|nr:hypothetical protein [Flavobacteriales bacterium]